jgi:nucleoside 2-deoxyribosyltransferase
MKIYIAGPLGFSEAGRTFYYDKLLPLLRQLGHELLDPWMLTGSGKIDAVTKLPHGSAKRDAWRQLNAEIGQNNRAAIDDCDAVVAVLDGSDVDSGTAAEIGYAFAKGKAILGYRGDSRLSADNEGCVVNLQVEYFIRNSGGEIVTRIADVPVALKKLAVAPPQRSD